MTDDRPPRPDPLGVDPDGVPETLQERDLWLVWRYEWKAGREEWSKVPKDGAGGGYNIDATDPDNGVSFEAAMSTYEEGNYDGLGVITDPGSLLVGFDFDDCRDPTNPGDSVPELITELLGELNTYTELSPSKTGFRAFAFGTRPGDDTRADLPCDPVLEDTPHLEIYDGTGGRYLTVTGQHLSGTPTGIETRPEEIEEIHAEYIADDESEPGAAKPAGDGGVQAGSSAANPTLDGDRSGSDTGPGELTDDELIEKAMNADNGEKFRRLWLGDTGGYESHSEADLALVGLLAFWTGGDRRRIDQLFRDSGLYRDKWDRDDYREKTIKKALQGRTEFYDSDAGDGSDDDTTDRPNEAGEHLEDADDGLDIHLCPAEVVDMAGLGDDEDVSDLTDREKAACVWSLLEHTDEYHVRVRRDNGSLWAYDGGVWKPEGERALRHAGRQALGSMNYAENVLTELKAQARADPRIEVESDTLGVPTGKVAVENGLVDLEAAADGAGTDAIRDLRPEDYALTRLPVTYDPDANAGEWKAFVGEVVEPEKIETMQEYVGYTLHRSEMPFAKAVLLVGSGSNGKTTFLNVVRELLGEDNTTTKPVHKFDQDNHVADLYGALANIDADLSEGSLSSEGIATFKRLVGGDNINARRLYEDAFSFKPTAKHLYAANQVPDVSSYVSDHDIAFWRRWIIVEFPEYFPPGDRDPDLEDRLTTDESLSGILNWAIDGWGRLVEQSEFTNVEDHDQTRQRWQSWGDSVEKFISECVERDTDADRISTGDAYARYQAWCRENGKDPVGRRRFTDTVKQEDVEYGRHRIDGKSQRGYKALGLSDDVPELDDGGDGTDDEPGTQTGLT